MHRFVRHNCTWANFKHQLGVDMPTTTADAKLMYERELKESMERYEMLLGVRLDLRFSAG